MTECIENFQGRKKAPKPKIKTKQNNPKTTTTKTTNKQDKTKQQKKELSSFVNVFQCLLILSGRNYYSYLVLIILFFNE